MTIAVKTHRPAACSFGGSGVFCRHIDSFIGQLCPVGRWYPKDRYRGLILCCSHGTGPVLWSWWNIGEGPFWHVPWSPRFLVIHNTIEVPSLWRRIGIREPDFDIVLDWGFVVDIKITEIPPLGSQWVSRLLEGWRLVASSAIMNHGKPDRNAMTARACILLMLSWWVPCWEIERRSHRDGNQIYIDIGVGLDIVSKVVFRIILRSSSSINCTAPASLSWLALSKSVKRTSSHG